MKHNILTAVKNGRLRAKFFTEDFLVRHFKEQWESNDSSVLDRALMLKYTELEWWVRPFMPKEIDLEREGLIVQNMTSSEALKMADVFEQANEDSNSRLIIVLDRKMGFRLKQSVIAAFNGPSAYGHVVLTPVAWERIANAIEETVLPLLDKLKP